MLAGTRIAAQASGRWKGLQLILGTLGLYPPSTITRPLYALINRSIHLILSDKKLSSGVRDYAELMSDLAGTNVSLDLSFQKRYRGFWAMNAARLSETFVADYFSLLETLKGKSETNVRDVAISLAQSKSSPNTQDTLHFSFASKLVHVLNPHAPVYDSLVAAFFLYQPPIGSFAVRLARLQSFYEFLVDEYQRVISSDLLAPSIAEFKSAYPAAAGFTDTKVVDFLIWRFVAIMRGGAQVHGDVVYS